MDRQDQRDLIAKESDFLRWYWEMSLMTGLDLDPDTPEHYYDYRAAYLAGDEPERNTQGQWKWPSRHKTKGHPTYYRKFER